MERVENIDLDLSSGNIVNVTVYLNFSVEDNYGADYDGNRGTSVMFLEDYEVEIHDSQELLTNEDKEEVEVLCADFVDNYNGW